MTDDHDRCEWVNISSDTVSPRLSRQNPENHKSVVVVVLVPGCFFLQEIYITALELMDLIKM